MAKIALNGRTVETDLVIFDKDGTLIDFHQLWGRKVEQWVEQLVRQAGAGEQLARLLYHALGYDSQRRRTVADGPLAVASLAKLCTIAAAILYQQGVPWHDAEARVREATARTIAAPPTPDVIKPLGDVAGLFQRLAQGGVRVVIATSDDRAATEATLPLLGIDAPAPLLLCGDDPLPNKPAPDGILQLSRECGIAPERIVLVGDTVSDMLTGRNAGVGCCVGVLDGAGERTSLAAHADVIINSLDDIQVLP